MKLLRTFALFSLLLSALILNWNCSDNGSAPTADDNQVITFGPNQNVTLIIKEYVKITPAAGEEYYVYLPAGTFICNDPVYNGNGNLCSSSFTTPAASRTINGDLYETQHYQIIKGTTFKCGTGNCNIKWYIQGILNYVPSVQALGSVCPSETGCATGTKYCGSYYDEDEPVTLSANTTYNTQYGGICFVE